jgi:polar amino acid transport system substrate-binding protein
MAASIASEVPMAQLSRFFIALIAGMVSAPVMSAVTLTLLTEESPPFNYAENGKVTGSVTEIVRQLLARSGQSATIEMAPQWDTAFTRAQAEKNTCIFATARLENRERLFLWVGPLATNLWALYGKGDFAVPIRALKDLAPYKIGAVTRDAKGDFLRENAVTNLKFVREDVDNPPRLLLPADNPDHIDLWITGRYGAREIARLAKVSDIKLVFIAAEQPLYLACNPQTDRGVVKALSDALELLKGDGSIARINAAFEKKFAQ